jgi:hypothetical protein
MVRILLGELKDYKKNRYVNEVFIMWLFGVCFYYGSIFGIVNT